MIAVARASASFQNAKMTHSRRSSVAARASDAPKPASARTLMGFTTIATTVGASPAAHAGSVSDKLSSALNAVDAAADAAQSAFDKVAVVVDRGVELANEAAPVVLPAAERAVKAVQPIGEAVGSYAQRELAPVAGEALKAASSAGAQVVSSAGGALKAQGVDVAPAVQVVSSGASTAYSLAKPALDKTAEFLSTASPTELAQTGGELFLAYLLLPVVFKVAADISRGYRGDLRPIEAYDALISSGNVVIVDVRGAEVTVALPGSSAKKVLVCDVEKMGGAFSGDSEAKVAALKISSLKGVKKNTKVILLDQSGGSAKKLAKSLSKLGFGKVFTVKGGFSAWSRQGLATTA